MSVHNVFIEKYGSVVRPYVLDILPYQLFCFFDKVTYTLSKVYINSLKNMF